MRLSTRTFTPAVAPTVCRLKRTYPTTESELEMTESLMNAALDQSRWQYQLTASKLVEVTDGETEITISWRVSRRELVLSFDQDYFEGMTVILFGPIPSRGISRLSGSAKVVDRWAVIALPIGWVQSSFAQSSLAIGPRHGR